MKSKNYSKLGLIEVVALLGGFQKANKTLKKELKKQEKACDDLEKNYSNRVEFLNRQASFLTERISILEKQNYLLTNSLNSASKELGGDREKDDRYLSRSEVKKVIDNTLVEVEKVKKESVIDRFSMKFGSLEDWDFSKVVHHMKNK